MAAPALPPGPEVTDPGHPRCGGKELFGHCFPVEAQGIGCGAGAPIASLRPAPEAAMVMPLLPGRTPVHRLDSNRRPVQAIRLPDRRQLLTDDVLRRRLLQPGDSLLQAEQMLGPADEREPCACGWVGQSHDAPGPAEREARSHEADAVNEGQ